jgi:hypothetical protein
MILGSDYWGGWFRAARFINVAPASKNRIEISPVSIAAYPALSMLRQLRRTAL